jgi:hypothetical protein
MENIVQTTTNKLEDIVKNTTNKLKSSVPTGYQLAAKSFTSRDEWMKDQARNKYKVMNPNYKSPRESYEAPKDINFAQLSKVAYTPNAEISNYNFIKEFSSPDRSVYQHTPSGHVIISFRGTDTKNWRDLTTDALLAMGETERSHRVANADKVTQKVIKKYGKKNVSLTGHSLGGSQALYVSRKYGVNAHVFNPHVSWNDAIVSSYYKDAHIYRNVTDPVPAFSRGANFKSTTVKSNPAAGFGFPQHGIDFWVNEFNKKNKKNTGKYTTQ